MADIQSGDVLLVEIDDSKLIAAATVANPENNDGSGSSSGISTSNQERFVPKHIFFSPFVCVH